MKNLYIFITTIILLMVPLLSACQNDGSTTVTNTDSPSLTGTEPIGNNDEDLIPVPEGSLPEPTGPEAPDDIVHTPGGDAYRANVHQEGVPDKWPPIQSVMETRDSLIIQYRKYVETKAGETRKNIIAVYGGEALIDGELTLYSSVVPERIRLTDVGGGGWPGMLLTVLAIEISPDITPDQYAFMLGIEVNDEDYGTLACTINIVE
jgi:hypothetical protein